MPTQAHLRLGHTGDHKAFTLIELLVVIAIIAILAATTLPMIPAVNDQARITTCESRLQQVGVALRLYVEDYHAMPPSLKTLYTARYVDQHAVLQCDKTAEPFFYKPTPLTADRGRILAACVEPGRVTGLRPHRHGTVSVQLHADGSTALAP